jgi:cytochrome c-type biogenesis protein CcmH/NrfG
VSKDSIAVGVAGVFFGVIVGWIIGSQQARPSAVPPAPTTAAAAQPAAGGGAPPAPSLDEAKVSSLKSDAQQHPSDPSPRVQLGNLYFDAGRYKDASDFYEQALKVQPRNVNVSTDLGISYYYLNEPDRALAQFDRSLAMDPNHAKTLLNIGIVRAFGKQDMQGAADVWQKVLVAAPGSEEARAAQQALEGLRAAHPDLKIPAPKNQGSSD